MVEDKQICAAWSLVMQAVKCRDCCLGNAAIYTRMRPSQHQSHFQCKPVLFWIPTASLFTAPSLCAAVLKLTLNCCISRMTGLWPPWSSAGSHQKLLCKDDPFPWPQQYALQRAARAQSAAQSKEMTLTKHEAFCTLPWRFHLSSSTEAPSPDLPFNQP